MIRSRPGGLAEPALGDAAPEALLFDTSGREAHLSFFWQEAPAILVFLRYFGCPFCQAQVAALTREERRFLESGANVVLIGHGDGTAAVEFQNAKRVPFPLLLDPDRSAYRAYGLIRGRLTQVFGPSTAIPFLKANLRDETRQRGLQGGDLMQLPGTFVVDSGGVVRFTHRNRHVADSPRHGEILDLVARLRRQQALA